MFKKVLISDDLGSVNQGVHTVLKALNIAKIDMAQYCDDAYLKVHSAYKSKQPYELLITDLSYIADHRTQKITSGEELVEVLKKDFPGLSIIVYSVEDRLQKVRHLVLNNHISGYVCKGRRGLIELSEAINNAFKNTLYLSPQVAQALQSSHNLEIDDYDIHLLKVLALGYSKEQISKHLKQNNVSPNSISSIEKRQNKLFIHFKANNATHLVAITKDLGLI